MEKITFMLVCLLSLPTIALADIYDLQENTYSLGLIDVKFDYVPGTQNIYVLSGSPGKQEGPIVQGYSLTEAQLYFQAEGPVWNTTVTIDFTNPSSPIFLAVNQLSILYYDNICDVGCLEGITPSSYSITDLSAPVPLPNAVWLFGSGLGLLALKTRSRKIPV